MNVTNIIEQKYSYPEMKELFSEEHLVRTYRSCWIALAKAQRQAGLKRITNEMIKELEKSKNKINLSVVRKKEKENKHDILAHIYAYGVLCPKAKEIIHLGATSQCIKCNSDLLIQYDALILIKKSLLALLSELSDKIDKTKKIACIAHTHYQPAQPTTIGKRLCSYAQDFLMDLEDLEIILNNYKLRGAKGATGTQASYLKLLGIKEKVFLMDNLFVKNLGFSQKYDITTQTYTRKFDAKIANLLASIATTCKKYATDIRLLSNIGILQENFGKKQAGSSAMPYKKNPMMCERICSLSRKLMNNQNDFHQVYAEQWLERTLDDSAIRRIDIPENFMLTDYILIKMSEVTKGLVVYENVCKKQLDEAMPFLIIEDLLMQGVKNGGDRQKLHEVLKKHAIETSYEINALGKSNNLLSKISNDKNINLSKKDIDILMKKGSPIGLSVQQTENFQKKLKHILRRKKI